MKKLAFASSVSASLTIIATVIVTVWAELSAPFKSYLKALTGHHWVSKSWMTAILFSIFLIAVWFIAREEIRNETVRKSFWVLIALSLLGSAVLTGFFAWHGYR
jgi:hypothetical protein